MRPLREVAASIPSALALVLALPLAAQAQAAPAVRPAFAGDCAVSVTTTGLRAGDRLQVELNGGMLKTKTVAASDPLPLQFATGSPLESGDSIRLRLNGDVQPATATVQSQAARPAGTKPAGTCDSTAPEPGFTGSSFDAGAYVGWAYDQFAPAEIAGYPAGTTTAQHNRYLFGVDFDYRVFGDDNSNVRFWIAGETLHGVRSADVDCAAEANKPAVCTPEANLTYARAVLANATSIEAYAAPRLEFLRVQKDASTAARLYVATRFGFIALEGAPRVYRSFHMGLGLMADNSIFAGSTFEVGFGNNELLSERKWKRLKIDGFLSVSLDKIPVLRDKGRFFIQLFIDNDLGGKTPDSIQTFIGFDFDFRKLLGG